MRRVALWNIALLAGLAVSVGCSNDNRSDRFVFGDGGAMTGGGGSGGAPGGDGGGSTASGSDGGSMSGGGGGSQGGNTFGGGSGSNTGGGSDGGSGSNTGGGSDGGSGVGLIGGSGSGSGGTDAGMSGGGSTDAGSTGGGSTGGGMSGGAQPQVPEPSGSCPTLSSGTITVMGQDVRLWVGPESQTGPMVFYWHGTGSSAQEAVSGLGPGLQEVMNQGGVVASFTSSTGSGTATGNNVWYTGDFEMADQIFACAVDQGLVNPRQVYTAGCSAGGLQASAMVYQRSSYLAGAMPNSGGVVRGYSWQDSHRPSVISTHGAMGQDVVFIDFSETTATFTQDIAGAGSFVVNCNHGGGHCGSPSSVKQAQWQFLKKHPFGTDPSPYASGLPSSFPSFCEIISN